jgi:pheromone shutdown protein TraB
VMEELGGNFPALSRVFINERDAYLAHSLQVAVSSNLRPVPPGGESFLLQYLSSPW